MERGLDTGLPLAGPGAPLISDFAVMELSALLGRSLDSGRNYVGQVVELAHRLPQLWARVLDGQVPVWKALRIADSTRLLPEDAAAYVDRQIAPVAHGCSWAQIDRLVEEALVRFDPEAAEERRREANEHRHVDLGLDTHRLRRHRPRHHRPGRRRRPGPGERHRPPRQAQRPARRHRLPRRPPRQSTRRDRPRRPDPRPARSPTPRPGRSPAPSRAARPSSSSTCSATDQTVGRFGNTRTPISTRAGQGMAQLARTRQ